MISFYYSLFLNSFLLLPLAILPTEAKIPFTAVKGITKPKDKPIFKEGYEHLNVIYGFLADISGLPYNLRFYGNYKWGFDEKGKRDCASDKGKDPISQIVRILFPSTAGDFTTTANHESSLGHYIKDPKIIAFFLNYIENLYERSKEFQGHHEEVSKYKKELKEYQEKSLTEDEENSKKPPQKSRFYFDYFENLPKKIKTIEEKITQLTSDKISPELQKIVEETSNIKKYKEELEEYEKEILEYKGELKEYQEKTRKKDEENSKKPPQKSRFYFENLSSKIKIIEGKIKQRNLQKKSSEKAVETIRNTLKNISKKLEYAKYKDAVLSLSKDAEEIGNTYGASAKYIIEILTTIDSYKEDSQKDPPHLLQTLFLSFFWNHYNTKEDIKTLYEALDDKYADKEAIRQIEEKDLLTIDDFTEIGKEQKDNIEWWIQRVYGEKYYSSVTPYEKGSILISNGDTYPYNRKDNKSIKEKTFADCVEVSLRHLFNFFLFKREQDFKSSLESLKKTLEDRMKEQGKTWKPHGAFDNLEIFYTKHQPDKASVNGGSLALRSAWNAVVGDLNAIDKSKEFEEGYGDFGRVRYHEGGEKAEDHFYNMHPGFINMLHAIEHVLGIRLEWLGTTGQSKEILDAREMLIKLKGEPSLHLENYKKAFKGYVQGKMQILLSLFKGNFTFNMTDFVMGAGFSNWRDGHETLENPYDLFESILKVQGKNKSENFSISIEEETGHSRVTLEGEQGVGLNLPPMEWSKIKVLPELREALQDPQKRDYKTPLYNILARGLIQDNDEKLKVMQTFLDQQTIDEGWHSTLERVLGDYSWEDQHTAKKGLNFLLKLLEKNISSHVFDGIRTLWIRDIQSNEDLSLNSLANIQNLYIQNIKVQDLELSLLDKIENLEIEQTETQKIQIPDKVKNLKLSSIKSDFLTIDLKNIEHLDLKEIPKVEFKNIQDSPIKSINIHQINFFHNWNNSKHSGFFSLSILQQLKSLKSFSAKKISVQDINGLKDSSSLEEINLTDIKFGGDSSALSLSFLSKLKKLQLSDFKCFEIKLQNPEFLEILKLVDLEDFNTKSFYDLFKILNGRSPQLKELALRLNKIETLNLINYPMLKKIDLSFFEDLKELELKQMPSLKNLDLRKVFKNLKKFTVDTEIKDAPLTVHFILLDDLALKEDDISSLSDLVMEKDKESNICELHKKFRRLLDRNYTQVVEDTKESFKEKLKELSLLETKDNLKWILDGQYSSEYGD